jgi:transcription elongation factor GreA
MLQPGAADHLGAHQPCPVAPPLAAKGLDAHPRHRGENQAAGDLDVPDPPRLPKIYLHRAGNSSRLAVDEPAGDSYYSRPRRRLSAALFSSEGVHIALKEVILTPEGFEKLKQEIEVLSTVKRREVAERIRIAREFGDIAENAEYDDAKNEQMLLEHRIATLEERMRDARVISKKDIAKDVVSIGSKVKLRDVAAKETVEYRIVGSAEANPAENKLSNESPVGKAIIGHKKGETVEVSTPRGALKFKILEIKAA